MRNITVGLVVVLLLGLVTGCYRYPKPQVSYPHATSKTVTTKYTTSGVVDGHSQAYYHVIAQDSSRCDVDPQDYDKAEIGKLFSCGKWHRSLSKIIDLQMPTER